MLDCNFLYIDTIAPTATNAMAFCRFRYFALMIQTLLLISCAATKEPTVSIDKDSNFDLTEYMFNKKVHSEGGSLSVVETYYKKSDTDKIALQPRYQFVRTNNEIEVTSQGMEGPLIQYQINANEVVEKRPSIDDARTFNRYARLGDTFLDADYSSVSIRETCKLTEFFETYYLASATGSVSLSRDIYDNVLKVHCESEFYEEGNRRTNYRWNMYYAKDVGIVFKDGDWVNHLGLVYALYDY